MLETLFSASTEHSHKWWDDAHSMLMLSMTCFGENVDSSAAAYFCLLLTGPDFAWVFVCLWAHVYVVCLCVYQQCAISAPCSKTKGE